MRIEKIISSRILLDWQLTLVNWTPRKSLTFIWIVFGFYGYGTGIFEDSSNEVLLDGLLTLSILSTACFYYFISTKFGVVDIIKVTCDLKDILLFLTILFLLLMTGGRSLNLDLTIDELYFAWLGQLHSYVILERAAMALPESVQSLQASSITHAISFLLLCTTLMFVRFLNNIRKEFNFMAVLLMTTLVPRLLIDNIGGINSNNAPLGSFFLFLSTSILGISTVAFRLSMYFLLALGITMVFRTFLKSRTPVIGFFAFIFVFLSVPFVYHTVSMVDVALFSLVINLYTLCKIMSNNFIIDNRIILVLAMSIYLRASQALIFIGFCLLWLWQNRQDPKRIFWQVVGLWTLAFPGLITILLIRYRQGVDRDGFSIFQVKRFMTVLEVFNSTNLALYLVLVMISLTVLLLLNRKAFETFATYLFFNVLLFNQTVELRYLQDSKYLLEYFVPLLAVIPYALMCLSQHLKLGIRVRTLVVTAPMLALGILNIQNVNLPVSSFKDKYVNAHPQQISTARDILPFTPYNFHNAFEWIAKEKKPHCVNLGAVYGVMPEILNDMTVEFTLENKTKRNLLLDTQSSMNENWLTISSDALDTADIDCVIIGSINDPQKVVNDLEQNEWAIRAKFSEYDYGTNVYIMTRS